MNALTKTPSRGKDPDYKPSPGKGTSLYGLTILHSLKPGDPIPTARVARAVFITPALATDWLQKFSDPDRRHIRPAKVDDYAGKMQRGEWVEMSKNLEFTSDPLTRLSDGHHRLKALAGLAIEGLWFEVHFGADPRSRRIEGVRLSRSPGDMLRMEGCNGYYSEIGAGVRTAMLYEQTVATTTRWRNSLINLPDAEDVVLYWLDDPNLWASVAPVAKSFVTSWPVGMAQGAVTGFVFLADRAHAGKGTDFLKIVAMGGGPADGRGRPVLSVFNQLLHARKVVRPTVRSGTQLDWNRYTLAVLIRAFNAWMAGKTTFQRPEWETQKPFTLEAIR